MAEQSFEKALAELEEIVSKLETGGLSLNESLSLFEKGVKLARFLRGELDKAEKKTEILLKDDQGEIKAEPFELSSNELQEKSADDPVEGEEYGKVDKDEEDLPF